MSVTSTPVNLKIFKSTAANKKPIAVDIDMTTLFDLFTAVTDLSVLRQIFNEKKNCIGYFFS